jgi:hypothetical protein
MKFNRKIFVILLFGLILIGLFWPMKPLPFRILLTQLTIWKNDHILQDRPALANPMEEVSLVVSSCDKYAFLWEPFFVQLFKFWPELKKSEKFVPIFLISNFKKYHNSRVINIAVGEDKSWSDNMIKVLESVKTKYVIILLDDYILTKPVNIDRLAEIINLLYQKRGAYSNLMVDHSIFVKQALFRPFSKNKPVVGVKEIVLRGLTTHNFPRNSLQACIWDTANFRKILRAGESAWRHEAAGHKRSKEMVEPFFALTGIPVFEYLNAVDAGKRVRQSTIDYIKSQGIYFYPENMIIEQD